MVIQFGCPGCHQPIEVDSQWAGAHVACPFCQRVVTAPTASTLDLLRREPPPSARRVPPGGTAAVRPTGHNRLAVLGLVFSVGAIALYIISQVLLQPLANQWGPAPRPEDFSRLANDPALMVRLLLGLAALGLTFLAWAAGLILSMIALTQTHAPGRRFAIAGVLCAALIPSTFCGGMLLMN